MIISLKWGGGVFSGTEYSRIVNDSYLYISGGTTTSNGGVLELYGKDHTLYAGYVSLKAQDSSNASQMVIRPTGAFMFFVNGTAKNVAMQEDFIPRSGGAVLTGTKLARINNDGDLDICGGTGYTQGGFISLSGKNSPTGSGIVQIGTNDGSNTYKMLLKPDGTATWGNKNLAMQEDVIPRSGGAVLTSTEIGRTVNDSKFYVCGGTSTSNGASVSLYGKDNTSFAGYVSLKAQDNSNYSQLIMRPSGTFTFDNNGTTKNLAMQEDVIPRSGGAVFTGDSLSRIDNTTFLAVRGGSAYNKGAQLTLYGKDSPDGNEGYASLMASDGTNISQLILRPSSYTTILCTSFRPLQQNNPTLGDATYLWGQIYSTNSTISTSDSRLKNTISSIDDSLLDAWETIQPKQYKFNDATESKGESARFHTGYLAQDIEKACTDNNIDATRYGLFCYDSWEEEPEISEDVEVEKDGIKTTEKRIIRPKREKGDAYSLRYEEALVVECAYLRREINKLKEELKQLKTR